MGCLRAVLRALRQARWPLPSGPAPATPWQCSCFSTQLSSIVYFLGFGFSGMDAVRVPASWYRWPIVAHLSCLTHMSQFPQQAPSPSSSLSVELSYQQVLSQGEGGGSLRALVMRMCEARGSSAPGPWGTVVSARSCCGPIQSMQLISALPTPLPGSQLLDNQLRGPDRST